jgi:RHS repeat-associated protein
LNKNITHIGYSRSNFPGHIVEAQDYPNATDYLCDATSNNLLAVTDEAGQVVEHLRYDPWGLRKNPLTWDTDFSGGLTDRGYTMHEHLDEFRLINMNGRIYDPVLGRFLSPDPFVTSPENPQNYNRYSYVLNNPLKYTDPSGYSKITNIINTLWSYDHGGTWTLGGGPHKFESHDEAFEAGIDYVNTTNSWGNTAYGSEQASRTIYNMIKNINYNYDINRNTVMYQGENRQYHFGYDRSTHTFYYVGTDTEVNPFEIIFGDDAANGGGSDGWAVTAAAGYMVALQADLVTPDPSDAAWPKWVGHAVLGTTSAIILYSAGKSILNPNLEGTTTSRGNPTDWSFDPEINRLQNDKYYPPGSKPPGWFWPAIGAAGAYELYQNWPKPNIPQPTQPVDNTYVAPARPIYPYGN